MNFENRTRFEIATEWFYVLLDKNISVEKIQEWQQWLAESPENAKEYERVEEVFNLSGDMEGLEWPEDKDLLRDDYDGDVKVETWQRAKKQSASVSFKHLFKRRLTIWRPFQVSTLSFVYAALFSIAIFNFGSFYKEQDVQVSVYESVTGQNKNIALSDGSVITLGAQSLVSVAFSKNQRQVVLKRGEAYFDVAKDSQRPFRVLAGNRVVTAVGTEFNVSKQHDRVVVTVAEGKVSLKPEQPAPSKSHKVDAYLVAGQRVAYDTDTVSEVAATPLSASHSWKDGKLQYMEEKLVYVVEDINRYSEVKIKFADEKSKSFRYSGTVFTGNLKNWVAVLPHAFPVAVAYVSDTEILLSAEDKRS